MFRFQKKYPLIVLVGLFILFFNPAWSQEIKRSYFADAEDSLKVLFRLELQCIDDSCKIKMNEQIEEYFETVLNDDASYTYPFDSLKHIGKLTAPDNQFRLYTWNTVLKNGTYRYFGFIQYFRKKKNEIVVIRLNDHSGSIDSPDDANLDANNWFGALYYKIIVNRSPGRIFYTLLGWQGNNDLTCRKIIEIVRFSVSGKPSFGAQVFKYDKKRRRRIIFEYSAKTKMTLTYDENTERIVFDHLSPSNPKYEGLYQFYGPDFSYDAFKFEDGKWILVKDVDSRNPKEKNPRGKLNLKSSGDIIK
ncbi:MAG: hypothetical protein NTW49_03450 [Bacteroidia bacterium]|nr:hypothetical protein [Bacteroidia bacterium]